MLPRSGVLDPEGSISRVLHWMHDHVLRADLHVGTHEHQDIQRAAGHHFGAKLNLRRSQ